MSKLTTAQKHELLIKFQQDRKREQEEYSEMKQT